MRSYAFTFLPSSRHSMGRAAALSAAVIAALWGTALAQTGATMTIGTPPVAAAVAPAPAIPAAATPATPAVTPTIPTAPPAATPAAPVAAPSATPAIPAPVVGTAAPTTPAPTGTPTLEVAAVAQPFVATVTGDKVYVRSGPDQRNYEIGQLTKGDTVYVVGARQAAGGGWYQILPPNGAFCMIAREFLDVDAAGTVGTVKGDYINVRAGSAVYKDADPYAVVAPPLRKGATVKVLGATDKFYQIAPPEKAYFFISAQFVKAAPGTDYKVAQLKLPAGAAGPSGVTVEAPASLPTVAVGPEVPAPGAAPGAATVGTAIDAADPLPPIRPVVEFSETATARFNTVSTRYRAESAKPAAEQNLAGLLEEFRGILTMENVSPSVKAGAQANAQAIERTLAVQRMIAEQQAASKVTREQTEALREQMAEVDKAIAAAREAGPYSAEGVLQSSTIVSGKYALVNPSTGRVVAYVDPSTASVDIGTLIGKYVGVRGTTKRMEGADIMVIQVNNATLMPQPK